MTRRIAAGLFAVSFALLGSACLDTSPGDDQRGPGPGALEASSCPMSVPEDATSCTDDALFCEYLIEPCGCGPTDIQWHCACNDGAWSCTRDYDCYPCQ